MHVTKNILHVQDLIIKLDIDPTSNLIIKLDIYSSVMLILPTLER
jgi:hypothetical protein